MNITKPVVDTLTWAASSDKQIDLPNEGLITEIELELYLTASGALASAGSVASLWRAIQSLKIEGGGGKVYFGMSGVQMGIMLHYLNLLDHPGTTWREIVATSQYLNFRLHFGSRPRDIFGRRNPFDLTCAIPAFKETNLKLTWGTTANSALDASVTISSATMRATVHEVLPTPEAIAAWSKKIPVSSSEAYDPGATKSDYSGQRDVPVGNHIRRIVIMCLDATAYSSAGPLLKADQMTEVGVLLNKENRWIFKSREQAIRLQNPKFDGMQVAATPNVDSPFDVQGLYNIDLRRYDNPDYGLDARRMTPGDVKLGMTIGAYGAAETEHIWYDQVQDFQL